MCSWNGALYRYLIYPCYFVYSSHYDVDIKTRLRNMGRGMIFGLLCLLIKSLLLFFLQLLLPLLLLLLLHNNLILDRAWEGWDWFLWFQVFAFFSAGTGKLLIWSFLFHHWLQTFGDSAHLCQVAFLAPYIDHLPQDGNKRRCARHIYSEMKSDPSSQRELIIMLDQTKRLHAK